MTEEEIKKEREMLELLIEYGFVPRESYYNYWVVEVMEFYEEML